MPASQPASSPRRGLVLSGGGALGAYQAGALVALKHAGIEFDVIAATSIGVMHALVWNRGEEMIHDLEDTWVDTVRWVKPFAAKRLIKLQNPFAYGDALDRIFARYRASQPASTDEGQVPIIVFLTDAETHRSVSLTPAEGDWSRDERELIYRASAAIPALGDRAIEIRGRRYYDGGFTNNLPLGALEARDLDEVWAITPFRRRKRLLHGLRRQRRHRSPSTFSGERIIIRPAESHGASDFRTYHAALFSVRNIQRLFRRGTQDGEAICREYLGR